LIQWASTRHLRPTAAVASAVISLVATVALACLSYRHQRTSLAPSTIVEGSLFFSVLFEAVQLRSYWLRTPQLEGLAVVTSISLAVRTFTLLIEAQPQRRSSDGPSETSIELAYGFLGQVSFWWLNPLFLIGWKAAIPMSSLWPVDAALSSDSLAERSAKFQTQKRTCTESIPIGTRKIANYYQLAYSLLTPLHSNASSYATFPSVYRLLHALVCSQPLMRSPSSRSELLRTLKILQSLGQMRQT
jgi:hypothetical protein